MSIRLKEIAAASIATPPSNTAVLFLDSATGVPSFKDDTGTVTPVTSGDPELAALAGLTSAANKIPMFSGSGTATLLDRDTDGTLAADSDTSIATQKATKTYVDAKVAGLSWKQAVRAATTAAVTLASDLENGDTIDGVTLATGDRILVKDQASATENGIYTVNASGAPTRATDADSGAELVNASVYVSEGTTLADTQWTCTTNATITIGATNITFAQFTSAGGSQPLDSDLTAIAAITRTRGDLIVGGASDWTDLALGAANRVLCSDGTDPVWSTPLESLIIAVGDETTAITTGTAKVTFRMPYAFTLVGLPRASLTTASSSGNPAIDINESGASIFSTTLTIDANEKTSTTAATAAVVSDSSLADDAEMTIDIDTAGTGAKGLKVTLIGRRT